jgi:hypothetical protein
MKSKKKTSTLLTPRGYESWQARQLLKSTQVPNKRAKLSKDGCKPRNWDND